MPGSFFLNCPDLGYQAENQPASQQNENDRHSQLDRSSVLLEEIRELLGGGAVVSQDKYHNQGDDKHQVIEEQIT